jgi:hypothetical protein
MGVSPIRDTSVRSKTWMSLRMLRQKDLLETLWKFPRLRLAIIDGQQQQPFTTQHFSVDESEDPVLMPSVSLSSFR